MYFISKKGVLDIGVGELSDKQFSVFYVCITLSFIEVYDWGNMLVSNKALMGR